MLHLNFDTGAIRHEVRYSSAKIDTPTMYLIRDEYNHNSDIKTVNTFMHGDADMLTLSLAKDNVSFELEIDRKKQVVNFTVSAKQGLVVGCRYFFINFPKSEAKKFIKMLDIAFSIVPSYGNMAIVVIKCSDAQHFLVTTTNHDGKTYYEYADKQLVPIKYAKFYDIDEIDYFARYTQVKDIEGRVLKQKVHALYNGQKIVVHKTRKGFKTVIKNKSRDKAEENEKISASLKDYLRKV